MKSKKPSLTMLAQIPETSFKTLGPDRPLCVVCNRGAAAAKDNSYVPSMYTHKLLFVFEKSPTQEEFHLLDAAVKKAGYARQDYAFVSAVRCGDSEPTMEELRCCRPYVLRAIEYLKPELVIGLGPSAARSLANDGKATNVTKLRGRLLTTIAGVAVCVTYPPSSVLNGGSQYLDRIIEDISRSSQNKLEHPVNAIPAGAAVISVDTEYAPDGALLTIGIADDVAAASAETLDTEGFSSITKTIAELPKDCTVVGHSLSGDVDYLVRLGLARHEWVNGSRTLDSLIVKRMADENRGKGGYDLESLLTSDHNVDEWKKYTVAFSKTDATKWPVDLRLERCRLDAWASMIVAQESYKVVETEGQPVELTHRIAMSLHRIELAGVYVNLPKFRQLQTELTAEREQYSDRLTRLAHASGMASFSPTNDDDLRTLLFKKLKLDVIKKTKVEGLPSVDKTTLKQHVGREEVDILLKFNKADKALSTNIEGVSKLLVPTADPDLAWLAVHINPLGARTGRRSSEKPNMQNWPQGMRQMIVSRYKGGSILEFDYKSLEVFLLAFEAQDSKLHDYFATQGGYIAVAKEMWSTEVKKGSQEYRATKSVVLGTNYNMQTDLMAENLWLMGVRFSSDYDDHTAQTDVLRNKYLDMFPGLRSFMEKQKQYVLKHQCARTLTGRVRHLPLPDGRRTVGFHSAVNQAINYPIQGLAAEVTGSALIDCEELICSTEDLSLTEYHGIVLNKRWEEYQIPLIINEVHDSLVFDLPYSCDDPRAKDLAHGLKQTMEQVKTLRNLFPRFTVPLVAEMKIAGHWGAEE